MYSSNIPNGIMSGTAATFGSSRAAYHQRRALAGNQEFSNQILSNLTAKELARLELFLERVTLVEGENLYCQEDEIQYAYFPENAVLSQFYILEDGRTMEIAMIGREGATGCSALFGATAADGWSQVSVAGSAYKISVEALKQEFRGGGDLQKLLLAFTNAYTTQISKSVVCNNYHSVERRFCTWLLMLCDRHGESRISLTHNKIANYLGVHRPSFTHIARNLREKGIIDYTRGQLNIVNRADLFKSACDCYTTIN